MLCPDDGSIDRRKLLQTVASGLGMAILMGGECFATCFLCLHGLAGIFLSYMTKSCHCHAGMQTGQVDAIGSIPETESSTRFAQHLVMNVPDIEEAVTFYTVGLGMRVRQMMTWW